MMLIRTRTTRLFMSQLMCSHVYLVYGRVTRVCRARARDTTGTHLAAPRTPHHALHEMRAGGSLANVVSALARARRRAAW